MSRKVMGIILGSVLALTSLGVYIVVVSLDKNQLGDNGAGQESMAEDTGQTASTEVKGGGNKQSEGNPFGEKVKTPLNEVLMQQYIHAMSHQKVQAKEKWSYYKITDERIDFLLSQLEINQYDYEETYKGILTNWKDGDFSNAVSDHNKIWRIQEGTIGKATGLLSPKAEEAYISEQTKEKR